MRRANANVVRLRTHDQENHKEPGGHALERPLGSRPEGGEEAGARQAACSACFVPGSQGANSACCSRTANDLLPLAPSCVAVPFAALRSWLTCVKALGVLTLRTMVDPWRRDTEAADKCLPAWTTAVFVSAAYHGSPAHITCRIRDPSRSARPSIRMVDGDSQSSGNPNGWFSGPSSPPKRFGSACESGSSMTKPSGERRVISQACCRSLALTRACLVNPPDRRDGCCFAFARNHRGRAIAAPDGRPASWWWTFAAL